MICAIVVLSDDIFILTSGGAFREVTDDSTFEPDEDIKYLVDEPADDYADSLSSTQDSQKSSLDVIAEDFIQKDSTTTEFSNEYENQEQLSTVHGTGNYEEESRGYGDYGMYDSNNKHDNSNRDEEEDYYNIESSESNTSSKNKKQDSAEEEEEESKYHHQNLMPTYYVLPQYSPNDNWHTKRPLWNILSGHIPRQKLRALEHRQRLQQEIYLTEHKSGRSRNSFKELSDYGNYLKLFMCLTHLKCC